MALRRRTQRFSRLTRNDQGQGRWIAAMVAPAKLSRVLATSSPSASCNTVMRFVLARTGAAPRRADHGVAGKSLDEHRREQSPGERNVSFGQLVYLTRKLETGGDGNGLDTWRLYRRLPWSRTSGRLHLERGDAALRSRRLNCRRSTQLRPRHTTLQPPQNRGVFNPCDQWHMFAGQAYGVHHLLVACWLSKACAGHLRLHCQFCAAQTLVEHALDHYTPARPGVNADYDHTKNRLD